MRRILYQLVVIILVLGWDLNSFATQPESASSLQLRPVLLASTQETPRMRLYETEFDFKEVAQGSVVSHDFAVWNAGNGALKIEQVGPTCECLKAHFDDLIAPGEEGKITLTLHLPDQEGPLERTVAVLTNDPENPDATLSIKVNVKSSLHGRAGSPFAFQSGHK